MRMVADAVAVEPVSTPKFPANRKKNREFCKLVAFGAAETPNKAVVARLLMQTPYSMEQGIILVEQGILAQEQGILIAIVQFDFRMMFSEGARPAHQQVGQTRRRSGIPMNEETVIARACRAML